MIRGQDETRRRSRWRSLRHCRGRMVVAEQAARPSSLYERGIRNRRPDNPDTVSSHTAGGQIRRP